MKSSLFFTERYKEVELRIRDFINGYGDFLSESTVGSPRAVGDAIQDILSEHCESILGADICSKYTSDFARRSMADLAFEDPQGCYYVVDVKTHRLSTKFNMPNLTSVERLARFYESDQNYFVILLVAYNIEGPEVEVTDVRFVPIEFFGWECLTIGALGWGQIQIANSSIVTINPGYSRRQWMLELCDALLEFYPREIGKINERMDYFRGMRSAWESRPDQGW